MCPPCDRGQRYCNAHCANTARKHNQQQAAQRYQRSRRGRFHHAARARRYRARQKNVTHQRSNLPVVNGLLAPDSTIAKRAIAVVKADSAHADYRCAGCGCRCRTMVRTDFLRNRRMPTATHRLMTTIRKQ
jgi:hypothetical protein